LPEIAYPKHDLRVDYLVVIALGGFHKTPPLADAKAVALPEAQKEIMKVYSHPHF
jgi:hypothetical protein